MSSTKSSNRNNSPPGKTPTGDRIWTLRKSLGLTQEQLARKARLSHGSIYRYEKKGRPPDPDELVRLVEALHTTAGYLMDGDPPVTQRVRGEIEDLPPPGVTRDAWVEILPWLPVLSQIYEARDGDDQELAEAWGWITGNLRMFRRGLHGKPPSGTVADSPADARKQGGSGETKKVRGAE